MDLSELIHSIDIVEYISQYIDLQPKGAEWWGLSCFKEEKTPSFSVRSDPPFFYDYSSGIGGNLFTFVKEYHHCSSQEAVEILRRYAGVTEQDMTKRRPISATMVCRKFRPPKRAETPSKATVLPEDYMDRYERRPEKLKVWEDAGISPESLEKFQVRYDPFSNRLVYPIRDAAGRMVNVGGRTLDPDFKAKGLRKYTYFHPWGTMDTIYGLWENLSAIQEAGEILLFEGCKSVLLADTWGIHHTGAILTSHLNGNQVKLLLRLGVRVVFALDKDVDVSKDKNIRRLSHYLTVRYIQDRGDLLQSKDSPVDQGKEVFQTLYDRFQYRF